MFCVDVAKELDILAEVLKGIRYGEITELSFRYPLRIYRVNGVAHTPFLSTLGHAILDDAYNICRCLIKKEDEDVDKWVNCFLRNSAVYMTEDNPNFEKAYKKFCEELDIMNSGTNGMDSLYWGADKYQQECLRTESGMDKKYPRILNGLMGLNGEAGECIDILKKEYFQGHKPDKEHLAEELGDVAWYLAISADALGYKLSDIMRMNSEKLRKRYPDGFESERSINR